MTTLIDRPATAPQPAPARYPGFSPVNIITAEPGQYSTLEVAQAYFSLGERPIPLCDAKHDWYEKAGV